MNESIRVYGIKNCDTVKKALVYLNDCDIDYQFIDFRQNPISRQVLKQMVDSVGWELLINKRSTTYRSLLELKEVIDTFFDKVMVNVDDIELRRARLKLLNRVRSLFLSVADVSYLSS